MQPFRQLSAGTGKAEIAILLDREILKAVVVGLPFGENSRRHHVVTGRVVLLHAGLVEHQQPVRVMERQRPQQHAAHHGEQRHVGADAESHDQNCDQRKSRRAPQRARGVAQIAQQRLNPGPAPGGARLVAQHGRIAEEAQRRSARLLRAHARSPVLRDLPLQMKRQLVIELRSGAPPRKQHPHAHRKTVESVHD